MDRQTPSVTSSDVPPPGGVTVVAIGASAGGIPALTAVLAGLGPEFPGAIVVVQHLDPHFRSFLARVLARKSRLPVREVTSGELLLPGVVYVAPPASHVVLRDGTFVLTDTPPVHFVRPSVDVLFASVAAACGPRAIGVILTGAGVDGAAGVRAIKSAGGRTIVQDPESAEHEGMPTAAAATGCVDLTLPLGKIGPALTRLVSATVPETTRDA